MGMQIRILNASTTGEIEAVFATLARERPDALFVTPDPFLFSRVDVIATPTVAEAIAAKAATTTVPIVFGVGEDPVKLGLVVSLARPGGNATGINLFSVEVMAKRLELLHELVPQAVSVVVLVNPAGGPPAEATMREVSGAARRAQIITLAARERIAAAYSIRDYVAAGGLMSYGTDNADRLHQIGLYTGKILNGTKPADLPVVQATKLELVINLKTAKALGLRAPSCAG
jgi:putative ABC transport system substrate-binding protein